jgi:hypothetical protein
MPIITDDIPFIPKRRRAAIVATAPLALQVIGVENVTYDEPVLTLTLVLNTTAEVPLVADALDPEKWSGVWEGGAMAWNYAEVTAFDRVTVLLQGPPGAGGASSVSYAADPSDVSDTSGRELGAFEEFPL